MSPPSHIPSQDSNYDIWARSDAYHNSILHKSDDALASALSNSEREGLPLIAVSAAQGKFLNLHARAIGAKRILEVGTLGGYSTIWLARALPADGELISLEISEKHAQVARKNIENAGLTNVKVIVGPAIDSLPNIGPDGSFDFVFVDADKESGLEYYLHAKRLVRKGGVIIVDNVVRNGRIPDLADTDSRVLGVRRLLEHIGAEDPEEVDATTLATVGDKGYDGFLYALKL